MPILQINGKSDPGSDTLQGLRVGVPGEYFVAGIQKEVEEWVRAAIKTLESLGAQIEQINLPANVPTTTSRIGGTVERDIQTVEKVFVVEVEQSAARPRAETQTTRPGCKATETTASWIPRTPGASRTSPAPT